MQQKLFLKVTFTISNLQLGESHTRNSTFTYYSLQQDTQENQVRDHHSTIIQTISVMLTELDIGIGRKKMVVVGKSCWRRGARAKPRLTSLS